MLFSRYKGNFIKCEPLQAVRGIQKAVNLPVIMGFAVCDIRNYKNLTPVHIGGRLDCFLENEVNGDFSEIWPRLFSGC